MEEIALRITAAIFIISVRPAPTRPNIPVTCREKTDMVALRTALPMETFSSARSFGR